MSTWILDWFFPRTRSIWYGMNLPLLALRTVVGNRKLAFWALLPVLLTLGVYLVVVVRVNAWAKLGLV
ncbi:MAG: hypothetical protein AAB425_01125, partial [Bdellovibrionota bacterium]